MNSWGVSNSPSFSARESIDRHTPPARPASRVPEVDLLAFVAHFYWTRVMRPIPQFIVGKMIMTDYLRNVVKNVEVPTSERLIARTAGPGDDLQLAGLTQQQLMDPFDAVKLIQEQTAP